MAKKNPVPSKEIDLSPLLGPEITRDLNALAAAHYDADRIVMIRFAVTQFIFSECGKNEGIRERYLINRGLKQ